MQEATQCFENRGLDTFPRFTLKDLSSDQPGMSMGVFGKSEGLIGKTYHRLCIPAMGIHMIPSKRVKT